MKLFSFMDNEFMKANIGLQDGFDPSLKAKTMAISTILGNQKTLLKWKWYFVLLASFLKCALLNKWPEKVDLQGYLKEKAEAQIKAQQHSKETECQPTNVVPLVTT